MMFTRRQMLATGAAAFAATVLPRPALADGFHGFDPSDVGPGRPSAADLKAMVADAMAKTPPRNGKHCVFGYTIWGGSSPFSQLNR